jgi:hypothetical protein
VALALRAGFLVQPPLRRREDVDRGRIRPQGAHHVRRVLVGIKGGARVHFLGQLAAGREDVLLFQLFRRAFHLHQALVGIPLEVDPEDLVEVDGGGKPRDALRLVAETIP